MLEPPGGGGATVHGCWSQMLLSILEYQWQLFDAPFRVGIRVMERALGPDVGARGPVSSEMTLAEKVKTLQRLAAERVAQGLPPPREAYQAPYRDLINWGGFPEWARPLDPELFECCGHEG